MRRLLILPLILLAGCQTLHFYSQGVAGQAEILWKSKSNRKLLASRETPAPLKKRIAVAEELCRFASEELALPGASAYHKYADLERRHVVFVLHAAREFSLEPKKWNYPFVGELDYRGYFKEADALAYAETLRKEGYEIHLGGTDAYSTLGVFHDPLLNTFIDYPEIDFAETIFHELTHRRIYRKDETTFNESLANTVAEEGVRRYLLSRGRSSDLSDYEERLVRRRDFYDEIDLTRRQLTALYASDIPEDEMRARKSELLANLKTRAGALQKRWGGKQLEEWLSLELTNAHLLALITYHRGMPRFRKLLDESDCDFETFFEKVEELSSDE
jgi:predicted aminopeptidase